MRLAALNGHDYMEGLAGPRTMTATSALESKDAALAKAFADGFEGGGKRLGGVRIDRLRVDVGGGLVVEPAMLDLVEPKVCPLCIGERPVVMAAWDLAILRVCPRHGIHLVSRCGACRKPLRWRRRSPVRCDCEAELSQASHVRAGKAERALATLIGRGIPALRCEGVETSVWGAVDISRLLDFAFRLGSASVKGFDHEGRVWAGNLSGDERDGVFAAAADVIANWPAGWHRFIERSLQGDPMKDGLSVYARFPFIEFKITRRFDRPEEAFIHREFLDFIEGRWPGWPRRHFSEEPEGLVLGSRVAARLGVDAGVARRATRTHAGKGVSVVPAGARTRTFFTPEALERIGEEYGVGQTTEAVRLRDGGATTAEVAEMIGASRPAAKLLLDAGLFGPENVLSRRTLYWSRARVTTLLHALGGDGLPDGRISADLASIWWEIGSPAQVALIRTLVRRGIRAVARRGEAGGLPGLLFSRADLLEVAPAAFATVNRHEAAEILECSLSGIDSLLRSGLLVADARRKAKRGARGSPIRLEGLLRLARETVSTGAIGRGLGVSVFQAMAVMERAGYEAVSPRMLWRREDADEVVAAHRLLPT